jgi:hypothetical protein
MIWATVLERSPEHIAAQTRGNYSFLQIPSVGDHIQLWNPNRQHFDFMQVLSIEHIPMPDPKESKSDWDGLKKADVLVICKLIEELGQST